MIQIANLSKKSQTATLEVPEGYKPSTTSNMGRRGKGKSKMVRAIEAAQADKERAKSGLPPLQLAPSDRVSLPLPSLRHGIPSTTHPPLPSLTATTPYRIGHTDIV